MSANNLNSELEPSELGTIEYWNQAYDKELKNFKEFGDEGEIWFGYHCVKRVIAWIKKANIPKTNKIIDLGCGNGYTCRELYNEGYTNVLGVDYSAKAIDLAKSITEKEKLKIEYKVVDILTEKPKDKYDICLDKGTYDAISLNPNDAKAKRLAYRNYVVSIMRPNGLFIITSCNWTAYELKEFFVEKKEFETVEEINSTVNFQYGGMVGQTTSTVVFKAK